MKRILPLRPAFYIALSVLFIGTLFRLQHWPKGTLLVNAGLVLTSIFFLLILVEIILSKKATQLTKILWAAAYLGLPIISWVYFQIFLLVFWVILGIVYLNIGRSYFLYTARDIRANKFDSI